MKAVEPSREHRLAGYSALAAAGSIWGTGFVFGKWALEELSVGALVTYRFAFASVVLAAVLWRELRRNPHSIRREHAPMLVIAAFIGVPVQYLLQFGGLAHTTVTHASLMVGLLPVLIAVAAAMFANERLDIIGWLSIVTSTIGAALVALGPDSTNAHEATLYGDALVVVSLFAGTVWILLSQRLMKAGVSSIATSAVITILGTLMLGAWDMANEGLPPVHLSLGTWLSIAAMGIVATALATLLWNWGLERVPASQAGVFVNLEPLIGAALGVMLFHDSFNAFSLIGGVLIVGAAVIVPLRHMPSTASDS